MPDDNEVQKAIIKEALHEWLDDKFATFGRWSMQGLAAGGLVGIVYLILWSNGWHK